MANVAINISILLIIIGVVLLITHYTTIQGIELCKKNVKNYKNEMDKIAIGLNDPSVREPETIIYSDRPTNTFKKMFLEPTVWLGYQGF
jgi:hypothetical protein